MAISKDESYFVVKDKDGDEYLCPLSHVGNRHAITEDEMDDCVERDIVERYSGNINIEPGRQNGAKRVA